MELKISFKEQLQKVWNLPKIKLIIVMTFTQLIKMFYREILTNISFLK